jgi:hypothetical protein
LHGNLLRCLQFYKNAPIAAQHQYDKRDGSIRISDRFQFDTQMVRSGIFG